MIQSASVQDNSYFTGFLLMVHSMLWNVPDAPNFFLDFFPRDLLCEPILDVLLHEFDIVLRVLSITLQPLLQFHETA